MKPKIHEMLQRTPEWYALRKGKLTASHADVIAAAGRGLDTYILKLVADSFSSADPDSYTNEHLQRGIELEDQARELYSLTTGHEVKQVGFIELNELIGCSPDGLVGEDGGIEIKCHDNKEHFRLLIGEPIDSAYLWQIQMSLFITGRKWWNYVAYNPTFEKNLLIKRFIIDPLMIGKLTEGIMIGTQKIKELMKRYEKI
jgi:putative phage-type endonuclease